MYRGVLPAFRSVYHVYEVASEVRRGNGSSGTRGAVVSHHLGAGNLGSLERQQVLLTTGPSLQLQEQRYFLLKTLHTNGMVRSQEIWQNHTTRQIKKTTATLHQKNYKYLYIVWAIDRQRDRPI